MTDENEQEAEQPKHKEEGPQAITFTATYTPDGKLNIVCPLMKNPMLMLGFITMIHDAVKTILSGDGHRDEPKIQHPGGFLAGIRRFKR